MTEIVSRGRDALDRVPRFRPDVVITALNLEDMRGADVCVELKKSRLESLPVVLYGQVQALASQEISENAHRADDFIQAPFDDGILVERVATLVGRGVSKAERPARPKSMSSERVRDTSDQTFQNEGLQKNDAADGEKPSSAPPPSASPAAVGPTKRSTRRVPCNISMSIRNGEKVYKSKTLDISHGGIFLATEEVLAIGTLIDMTFQIPNSQKVVTAVGKVAWVGRAPDGTGTTAGVGVKFSKIDPADLQVIVDYVNRVSRVVYSAS
jgi:uncharacterized protein (TIGR02266 family)